MEDFWNSSTKNKYRIRYRQSRSYSPYSEFFSDWKQEKDGITYLAINSFYRFDSIMEPLFQNGEISGERRDWLFDVMMHYLIELEFRGGMTQTDWEIHSLIRQIENGRYGQEIAGIYRGLSEKEKYYVAYLVMKQEKTKASVEKYAEALSVLLENGIVYKNKFNDKTLLLYVGKRENAADSQKIRLITELFQPLGYHLNVFWEKHFAVIDEKQTMEIGEIELL